MLPRSFAARHPRLLLAVLSLVCGTLYAASIIGWKQVNPTDISWLRGDPASSYLGFALLRQNPVTNWPLTLTDRIGYPLTLSVSTFDLVPLLAIASLPFSRVLPASFQYFGLFQCFAAAGLFYLGHQVSRIHGRSELLALASGTLCMTSSVFTARLGGHIALAGQFCLLWVLYEGLRRFARTPDGTFRTAPEERRAGLVAVTVLNALALGVNPYIALMMLFFSGAYALALLRTDRDPWRFVLGAAAGGAILCLMTGWFFGYLGVGGELRGTGFGEVSANLNTLVNPMWGSRFFEGLPVVAEVQLDGSAYLGVALMIVLAGVLVGCWRSPGIRRQLSPFLPFLCVAVVAFAFALSDHVTLGSRTLFRIPLPPAVRDVLSVFRSTGRLTWPLFYALLAVSIVGLGLVVPERFQASCGLLVAALQLFEFAALRDFQRAYWSGPPPPVILPSAAFRHLGESHRHLVVLPAWQCGPPASPGGVLGYATLGMLAAEQRMTINSYYASRYSQAELRVHCRDIPGKLRTSGPEPDTAYVVQPEFLPSFSAPSRDTHECGERDGLHLCVRRGTLR